MPTTIGKKWYTTENTYQENGQDIFCSKAWQNKEKIKLVLIQNKPLDGTMLLNFFSEFYIIINIEIIKSNCR